MADDKSKTGEVIQFPGPKVAPTVEVVTDAEAEARLLKVLEEMFYGDAHSD